MYWQNPNSVVLGGNITGDPRLKDVGATKILEFSIANNLKSTGSEPSKPNYFRCEAWGKTAEIIAQHFSKGDAIIIQGSLQWHSWQDKDSGQKREIVKIRVDSFFFPAGGSKAQRTENTEAEGEDYQDTPPPSRPQREYKQHVPEPGSYPPPRSKAPPPLIIKRADQFPHLPDDDSIPF